MIKQVAIFAGAAFGDLVGARDRASTRRRTRRRGALEHGRLADAEVVGLFLADRFQALMQVGLARMRFFLEEGPLELGQQHRTRRFIFDNAYQIDDVVVQVANKNRADADEVLQDAHASGEADEFERPGVEVVCNLAADELVGAEPMRE